MPPVTKNAVGLLTWCVLALGHTTVSCKSCPVKKLPGTGGYANLLLVGCSKQHLLLCGKEQLQIPNLWLVLAGKDKQAMSYNESII